MRGRIDRIVHAIAPSRAFAGALFLIVSIAVGTAPANAQPTESGAYKGWQVSGLDVRGVDNKTASALKNGLALAQTQGLLRTGRPTFYPQILSDDIDRCRLYLARHGYPYAVIAVSFRPRPSSERVDVILNIAPGPPVVTTSVSVEGFPPGVDTSDRVETRPREIFADPRAEGDVAALRNLLRENGYARAEVECRVERTDSTRAVVKFVATPGPRYYFGDKIVLGTRDDLVPLARKTMETTPGEFYSPAAMQRSRNNLRLLELYRQVRVDTRARGADTLDVVADLVEREPRLIETGLGYWTDDLIRVRARWLHRNLFHRGRGLSIGASASRYLQTGNVSVSWPAILGARTRAGTAVEFERHNEDSYDLVRTGINVYLTYQHSLFTHVRAGVQVSSVDVTVAPVAAAAIDASDGLLTVLSSRWSRNTSDDRLYPTRGTTSWVLAQWAPNGAVSDNHFVSVDAGTARYQSLGRHTVLAARIKAGVAEPTGGSTDLLPNVRFFSGGASSMRGFKRRRLGPLDAAGDPIGGNAVAEAAAELRFPLLWRFRGALFVDTGQVWERWNDARPSDLAVAVGPGLRLATPVGPIRTDFGYRVTSVSTDEPRWVFHLSIGPAF